MEGNQRPPPYAQRGQVTGSTVVEVSPTTQTQDDTASTNLNAVELRLTLRPRPTVTWDESILNNEGLNRKSSKRCCIFHKKRDFGESSTESDEDDNNQKDDDSSSDGGGSPDAKLRPKTRQGERKKIAHRKAREDKSHVPNSQRFHA